MLKTPLFKHIIAFSLPLLTGVMAHGFEYRLVTSLPSDQRVAVQNLLKQAEQKLPETLKAALRTVDVRFDQLPSFSALSPNIGVASFQRRDLTINTLMLAEIVKGPQGSTRTTRTHGNMYNEVLATVLHETTHLYDFANVHSDSEKEMIRRCDTKFAKSKEERIQNGPRPYACKYYEKMTTSFSSNPYYLQVAGWTGQSENVMNQRSPDIYELKDKREHFAVNMEYFLMDPQFKCRRPSLYKVLSSQFQHVPFQNVTCETQLGYVIPNSGAMYSQILQINPDRIYQVHYLFAEKGSDISSGWGHSMIRLVMCAPERKTVGPDCLRDVEYSVVLSFRAWVESIQLSMWAGLAGDYSSRLFILPLSQVVDEYPKGQFRSLRSIPLKLTREQIRDLVVRSVETHWGYEGRYKFITANCATETLDLLQSVLQSPAMMNVDIKTPAGLYSVLQKLNLADDSVFRDPKTAKELGYYFESYEERYNNTFKLIKDAGFTPLKVFKEWIKADAAYRQKVIRAIPKSHPEYKKMIASLFVLEFAAQRQIQTYILQDLTGLMAEGKTSAEADKAQQTAKNYMKISELFAKPSSFLPKGRGYGLPLPAEMAAAKELVAVKAKEAIKISEETKKMADQLTDTVLMRQVETSNENIKLLQQLLRSK
ncbi:hypothetical protein DOM22_02480 [Bdellovibrio sp. ZAP7]|uniref:DUF7844 domain-containing protein n=1 Tax=Bdellovibrio sp. ZAP7 TaxID=2231053 RepID=UPI00115BB82E|nr:DUF4105 domain-containing protein [Bdellovibrio sp. ZAP7]QDK44100.1 hypothetical protein DOM22_02480 [Bdellovibrio sp. ZAP7]